MIVTQKGEANLNLSNSNSNIIIHGDYFANGITEEKTLELIQKKFDEYNIKPERHKNIVNSAKQSIHNIENEINLETKEIKIKIANELIKAKLELGDKEEDYDLNANLDFINTNILPFLTKNDIIFLKRLKNLTMINNCEFKGTGFEIEKKDVYFEMTFKYANKKLIETFGEMDDVFFLKMDKFIKK